MSLSPVPEELALEMAVSQAWKRHRNESMSPRSFLGAFTASHWVIISLTFCAKATPS